MIKGQIISTIDTINVLPSSLGIKLQQSLIIDSSFVILNPDLDSIDYSLDPINGLLFINNQKEGKQSIIVRYDYYSISLPTKIGPKWLKLPIIDSLMLDKDLSDNNKASVPVAHPTPNFAFAILENLFSSFLTFLPKIKSFLFTVVESENSS